MQQFPKIDTLHDAQSGAKKNSERPERETLGKLCYSPQRKEKVFPRGTLTEYDRLQGNYESVRVILSLRSIHVNSSPESSIKRRSYSFFLFECPSEKTAISKATP